MKLGKNSKEFKHYQSLAAKELEQFALQNNLIASEIKYNENIKQHESTMKFGDVEIHFIVDTNVFYGYRFLEASQLVWYPCLVTRFKYAFSDFYFSPYDIHNALELSDFRTLDFHSLLDDDMAQKAFGTIFDFIIRNRFGIERICSDVVLQQKLLQNYQNDMAVVSKKIVEKEKLNKDFNKYILAHENNLNNHNYGSQAMFDFVSKGKRKSLEDYFLKYNRNGKLLTFEKRFYDYLMQNDFSMLKNDSKYMVQKIAKDNKARNIIDAVSAVLSFVTISAIDYFIWDFSQKQYESQQIIYSDSGSKLLWIVAVIALCYLYSLIIKRLFFKKSNVKDIFNITNKTLATAIVVICLALIAGFCALDYADGESVIALGDNSIIVNYSFNQKEELPYGSDDIKFFLIQGYYDDSNSYVENGELIAVLNNDYDDYIICDVYDDEENDDLQQALDTLNEKGADVVTYKDIETFWSADKLN
jgi:hypothetical protein